MSVFDRAAGVLATRPQPHRMMNAKKAITQASAPTAIEPETADRLIDFIEDLSRFLGLIRVERMSTNEKNLSYIDMSAGLLRPGGCATDDSDCDTGTITGTQKVLSTKEMKAVIPICDNMLEDNVEGAALEDHVLRMVAKVLANELETLGLMAGSGYNSALLNNTLEADWAAKTGFYEELQTGHVLNGLTASDGRFITPCKVQQAIQALPVKYRSDMSRFRLFIPDDMQWDWVGLMKNRGTALGDMAFTGEVPLRFGSVSMTPLPLIPTDITSCLVGSASGNGTFAFLGDPDNFVYGIQRDITFERERKGCQGRTFLIWTLRVDFLIDNVDETVLWDCLDVGQCSDCECPS